MKIKPIKIIKLETIRMNIKRLLSNFSEKSVIMVEMIRKNKFYAIQDINN